MPRTAFILASALAMLLVIGCGNSSQDEAAESNGETGVSLSSMGREGEGLFDANCSVCHGEKAAGTNQAPTSAPPSLTASTTPATTRTPASETRSAKGSSSTTGSSATWPPSPYRPTTWRRSSATSASCSVLTASSRETTSRPCVDPAELSLALRPSPDKLRRYFHGGSTWPESTCLAQAPRRRPRPASARHM